MHQYLKSIGFSEIKTRKQLKELLSEVEQSFTSHKLIAVEDEVDFGEFKRSYGEDIGVSVCGFVYEDGTIEREFYFPYFAGSGITSYSDVIVDRRIEKEAYVGICEDVKVGISLIFHLQNAVEYMREKQLGNIPKNAISLTLSGIASSGKILLPIMKNEVQEKTKREEARNRMMLLSAAREGSQEAIESLTLDDIDTYSKVSRRLVKEDIFSIVETYFMPHGVECDQYSIMGEILSVHIIENLKTHELLYRMTLDVNELVFDVCVPMKNLLGEPEVGRRFKGDIWLQGQINC